MSVSLNVVLTTTYIDVSPDFPTRPIVGLIEADMALLEDQWSLIVSAFARRVSSDSNVPVGGPEKYEETVSWPVAF
jgi:hypothetical protein